MKTIVAIDVSKDKASYFVKGTHESQQSIHEFPMTQKGFKDFLSTTTRNNHPAYFMESTGRYHLTLLQFLLNHNQDTFVVNPVLIKNFSKVNTLRKTKTDKADARMIAEFASQQSLKLAKAEYGLIEEIRSIARRREQLAEEVAKAKTQIKADLCVAFPEILTVNIFTGAMLRLLSQFSSPEKILSTSEKVLADLLKETGKGRCCNITASNIIKLAEKSIGIESYGPLACDSVKHLISVQKREKVVAEVLFTYIHDHYRKEQEILESIPGIGKITTAHFLSEIGNIRKFPRYQSLIAFCGTDPSIYESGSIQRRGHITKHGNSSLRKYVYLMATGAWIYNPLFRAYYDKKRKEGFPHRKAMVALMNKLLRTIYALLTKGEKFNTSV